MLGRTTEMNVEEEKERLGKVGRETHTSMSGKIKMELERGGEQRVQG